ncbi:class I lanthipeptide [Chryseobacterium sp. R2ACT005]|uniref:class I lanthipeptide n=1 Tax=Chryseobacterium sp. R2ACT005 TaxID=3416668 RepID=UPI003CF79472
MKKRFSNLELNKKSIAKLNDQQLTALKGGNAPAQEPEIKCQDKGSTIVCTGTTVVE